MLCCCKVATLVTVGRIKVIFIFSEVENNHISLQDWLAMLRPASPAVRVHPYTRATYGSENLESTHTQT